MAVPRSRVRDVPAPDRRRWGDPLSYKAAWADRARLAAALVPDGVTVLEIGVGAGVFRDLVKGRVSYLGADLEPLDDASIALDLDSDPLPAVAFDYAVLLGVFGYLHRPEAAAQKICAAAERVIVSYSCRKPHLTSQDIRRQCARRGWVNDFDLAAFAAMFRRFGHEMTDSLFIGEWEGFVQFVMVFRRADAATPA